MTYNENYYVNVNLSRVKSYQFLSNKKYKRLSESESLL